jgi:hypothetical protein
MGGGARSSLLYPSHRNEHHRCCGRRKLLERSSRAERSSSTGTEQIPIYSRVQPLPTYSQLLHTRTPGLNVLRRCFYYSLGMFLKLLISYSFLSVQSFDRMRQALFCVGRSHRWRAIYFDYRIRELTSYVRHKRQHLR